MYSFKPSTRPIPAQQPNPTGAFPFGLGGMPGMDSLNLTDMQQQLQQQVWKIKTK